MAGWLEAARQALLPVADQPSIEAQAMLSQALGKTRAWIFAYPEADLAPDNISKLNAWVDRRMKGEPLPYVLGRWEFYGLEFEVSPTVLIPRPETEMLVDLARTWLRDNPPRHRAVDVGTGSGCIAAALAQWVPSIHLIATDISYPALVAARRNLAALSLQDRVRWVQADLLAGLSGPFDLICANLPYIPSATLAELDVARYEPSLALDGGYDGLRLIEPLLHQASSRMAPGGRLLFEIEMSEGLSAHALASNIFPQAQIEVKTDLAGLPRLLLVDLPA